MYHVKDAPHALDEVLFSPGNSVEVPPMKQLGLWATEHCPKQFLERCLVGWFSHQFLRTPVLHLLRHCPVLGPRIFSVSRGSCRWWSHLSAQASLSCSEWVWAFQLIRIRAQNSPKAEYEATSSAGPGTQGRGWPHGFSCWWMGFAVGSWKPGGHGHSQPHAHVCQLLPVQSLEPFQKAQPLEPQ